MNTLIRFENDGEVIYEMELPPFETTSDEDLIKLIKHAKEQAHGK
jgi:hypothetical protein